MEAVDRLRRRTAALADVLRRLRRDVDEGLLDVAEDIEYEWPKVVAGAVATAVILIGLCRLVLSLTVGARPAIAGLSVALVCAVAAACVAGLVWVDLRNRRRNEREGIRFVVGIGVSLAAIGICIEALAGVTTLLWQRDLIAGPADIEPSLWRSETFYIWHLFDWIPLVDITDGIPWREPTLFSDSISGALLLGLKVLALAPLLRVAIGAYRWVTATVLEDESKWLRSQEIRRSGTEGKSTARKHHTDKEDMRLPWVAIVLGPAYPVAMAAVMPLIFEPDEGLDAWWTQLVEGAGAGFLRTAPQWIGVFALVGLVGGFLGELLERYLWVHDQRTLVQVIVAYATLVGYVLVTAAALSLALLHVGVATPRPELPAGGHVRAALEAHLWHFADSVGWDLPDTLRWSLPYDFVDGWSAGLFLATRLFIIGVLVIPVAQAILSFAHFRRMRRPVTAAGLEAVTRFGRRFRDAQVAIDRAGNAAGEDIAHSLSRGVHLGNAAIHAVELVTEELDSVRMLFGAGEMADRAEVAVAALLCRLDTIDSLEDARFLRRGVDIAEREFGRLREEEHLRYEQYRYVVRSALKRSAKAV